MMWSCWFVGILFFNLLTPELAPAGDSTHAILRMADRYAHFGNHFEAITEYRRFVLFAAGHPDLYYAFAREGESYENLGLHDEAARRYRQSVELCPDPTIRRQLGLRLAWSLVHASLWDLARIEFFLLARTAVNQRDKLECLLPLAILEIYRKRFDSAGQILRETAGMIGATDTLWLRAVQELASGQGKKSPVVAKWLSTFVPGLGQMYAGRMAYGLHAFLLNTGTTYLVADEIAGGHISSAVLVFSLVWQRYYLGNRQRAESAAVDFNNRKEALSIKALLEKIKSLENSPSDAKRTPDPVPLIDCPYD